MSVGEQANESAGKYGISSDHLKQIVQIIKDHLGTSKNPRLYIYGSRVKGGYRPYSDIDLLLKADVLDREALKKIEFSETDLPYKVDFVLDPDLYQAYREEIEAHMQELKL